MRHRNKENNSFVYRHIHQDEVYLYHRNIRIYTKINTLEAIMVHLSAWMRMLDTDKRPRKKTWSSRNVVHQNNNDNILDWKKSNQEVMEMAGYRRSRLETIRKRQLQSFWHIKKAGGLEKQIFREDSWYQKQRKTTHNLLWQSELRNEKRISQHWAHQEIWRERGLEGHIADACNRPGTWWWWWWWWWWRGWWWCDDDDDGDDSDDDDDDVCT